MVSCTLSHAHSLMHTVSCTWSHAHGLRHMVSCLWSQAHGLRHAHGVRHMVSCTDVMHVVLCTWSRAHGLTWSQAHGPMHMVSCSGIPITQYATLQHESMSMPPHALPLQGNHHADSDSLLQHTRYYAQHVSLLQPECVCLTLITVRSAQKLPVRSLFDSVRPSVAGCSLTKGDGNRWRST